MSDNIFDLYSRPDAPGRPDTPPQPDRTEYVAAEIERANITVLDVLVYYGNGDMELTPYAARLSVLSSSDNEMSWVTMAGSIDIRGQNLRQLFPALQARTVKTLRVFDPLKHLEPAKDAPVIERMDYKPHPRSGG